LIYGEKGEIIMIQNEVEKVEMNETEEVEVEVKATKSKKVAHKEVKKYAPTDMIPCRSITYGELLLTGAKSRWLYRWSNYGDVTEMEFQDLQALRSTRSTYLFKPRFIIEDPELVEQWKNDLGKMYDDIIAIDVEELFKLPVNQLRAKLKKAPAGIQQAVKNIAGEKIMNASLDSLAKIKAIDEILGTELKLYIS
jgi:hypothetical protein